MPHNSPLLKLYSTPSENQSKSIGLEQFKSVSPFVKRSLVELHRKATSFSANGSAESRQGSASPRVQINNNVSSDNRSNKDYGRSKRTSRLMSIKLFQIDPREDELDECDLENKTDIPESKQGEDFKKST